MKLKKLLTLSLLLLMVACSEPSTLEDDMRKTDMKYKENQRRIATIQRLQGNKISLDYQGERLVKAQREIDSISILID